MNIAIRRLPSNWRSRFEKSNPAMDNHGNLWRADSHDRQVRVGRPVTAADHAGSWSRLPVCVTPIDLIDKAVAIAQRPEVIFCSFGDMLRVPGSSKSLFDAKAEGADVRIVYSPLDALKIAKNTPERQVVFFAVGFETTAPANAMAAWQADHDNIDNFSLLVSHVLVPPAMEALLSSENCVVQGFLAAGHVCTIMGYEEYFPIVERYKVPIVVTGFEPLDILDGILMTVSQLEEGRHEVENQYARATRRKGNRPAQERIAEVFEVVNRQWRGLGEIPASGFQLRGRFQKHDANRRYPSSASPRASRRSASAD